MTTITRGLTTRTDTTSAVIVLRACHGRTVVTLDLSADELAVARRIADAVDLRPSDECKPTMTVDSTGDGPFTAHSAVYGADQTVGPFAELDQAIMFLIDGEKADLLTPHYIVNRDGHSVWTAPGYDGLPE